MPLRIQLALVELILISLFVAFSTAIAEERPRLLQLVEPYSESFMMSGMRAVPPPSADPTRVLVGLHLGKANGAFQIDQIGILLSPKAAAKNFCVRVSSGDTRYDSVNLYRRATNKNTAPLVETKSAHAAELAKQYKSSEIPIRIVELAKCSTELYGANTDGPVFPAIPPGVKDAKVLVAFLNVIGSRAAVRLLDGDKVVAEGACQPADESVTLFSDVCDLPVTNLGKAHPDKLQVIFVDQSAQRVEIPYRIEWAEPQP